MTDGEVYCKKCGHYYLKILNIEVWFKDHALEAGVEIEVECPKCGYKFTIERDCYD